MRKYILLIICCCLSVSAFSQTDTTVTIYATEGVLLHNSGYVDSTFYYISNDSIESTSTNRRGYVVFDLSSIPAGVTVSGSTIGFYLLSFTAGVAGACNTYGYAGDLSTVTDPHILFSDMASGTLLFSATPPASGSYGNALGADSMTSVSAPVTTFIQSSVGNIISICFTGGGTNAYQIYGVGTSYKPYLRIKYDPYCAGTPPIGSINANALLACDTSSFTLTNTTTYLEGVAYQWQSSPDSATWSNITGATTQTYTFSGLSSSTYYRCMNTCIFGGVSSVSAGVKILYAPCCTGTPSVGTATASTTYCSSCSLTLGLTGYPVLTGLTFQWEQSPDNTWLSWSNIPGATSIPYTFAPDGAYYYRCKVTCVGSGLSSYSSNVFVPYAYHIIADSIINPPATSCIAPGFFTEINGTSSLLRLKTYYGDGTSDSVSVTAIGSISSENTLHAYASPGFYSLKQILYYNNLPQDSIAFHYYEYVACKVLPVKLFLDINVDCIKENTEPYSHASVLIKVDSNGIPVDTISATSGLYYKAYGPLGTIYSFSIISNAFDASCFSSSILFDTIIATVNTYPIKYLGLSCSSSTVFDLVVTDVIPVTGENDEIGNIYASNNFCTPINATITLYHSPKYPVLQIVHPTPTAYTSSTITWNVIGLSATSNPLSLYYAIFDYSGSLTPGDTVHSYVTITPTTGDIDAANNSEIIIDTILASCDPNEMSVSPAGCIAIDSMTKLQYTINFTNVGNDTAFNIYVMDTLSNNIDPKSLRIIMASNTMNTYIFSDGINNIVKFDFPQINLLDSAVCPQCSGAVIFNVNTLPGLPDGATIFNHAGVFFDYNPVVLTNTVENIIGNCTSNSVGGVSSPISSVQMFPNPTTNELTIKMSQNAYTSFSVTNSIGQEMIQQPLVLTQTQVDVSALTPGLYYITFRGDNGTRVEKFVKM